MHALHTTQTDSSRRGDVDVMRAALVIGLVFFHTANIFDLLPYAVKNEQTSILLMLLVGFFSQWGMPLLFFTAGVATRHSLTRRSAGEFVLERLRRLLVPFIVGMLVIVPPQRYFGLLSNPDFKDSFPRFYPRFFRIVFAPDFPLFLSADPAVGYFEISHLWFLYYLLIFSLLALPFLLFLKTQRGRLLSSGLARWFGRERILFFAVPIVLVELFLRFGGSGGWNRLSFLVFLICGYLFASDAEFERSARTAWPIALLTGIISITVFFWISALTWQSGVDPSRGYGGLSVLWRVSKACASWFWVVAIWGMGQAYQWRRSLKVNVPAKHSPRRRTFLDKAFAYANEAVLPFYVIHQTVIVIIGYYVVRWSAGISIKYFTISLASVALTFLLYDIFVRRSNITRVLFGMKPKRRSTVGASPVQAIT